MNAKLPNGSDEGLSVLLQNWREEAPLPPQFAEGVWRKIVAAQDKRSASGAFWSALVSHWENLVRQPAGAATCLALFIALGVGLGLWHAHSFAAKAETAWQHAYIESVSPTTIALLE